MNYELPIIMYQGVIIIILQKEVKMKYLFL